MKLTMFRVEGFRVEGSGIWGLGAEVKPRLVYTDIAGDADELIVETYAATTAAAIR